MTSVVAYVRTQSAGSKGWSGNAPAIPRRTSRPAHTTPMAICSRLPGSWRQSGPAWRGRSATTTGGTLDDRAVRPATAGAGAGAVPNESHFAMPPIIGAWDEQP